MTATIKAEGTTRKGKRTSTWQQSMHLRPGSRVTISGMPKYPRPRWQRVLWRLRHPFTPAPMQCADGEYEITACVGARDNPDDFTVPVHMTELPSLRNQTSQWDYKP